MKCARCQRELAPELSMCVRCGAMKDDSVREELELSLTRISGPLKLQMIEDEPQANAAIVPSQPETPPPAEPVRKVVTADLGSKKTSPTLADFVNKNATMPDWRLKIQNSVRQRAGRAGDAVSTHAVSGSTGQVRLQTSGANALQFEYADAVTPADAIPAVDDKLASALKRIEASRRAYLPTEKAREGLRVAREAREANRKFKLVSRSENLPDTLPRPAGEPEMTVRPKLVSSLRIEKKFDTNKLVPIPEAAHMASSFDPELESIETANEIPDTPSIKVRKRSAEENFAVTEPPAIEEIENEADEIDDLAPIAMRFNAGLFDLIIGGFATFVLLSPFLAFSEGWFSITGLLLFATMLMIVMFIYLTGSIAYFGQTIGMKIFSLELIDVEQSEFPTLHQAAVSSAVYLFSLILGGLGFVPILLNEEKRAAHDLISGTILVREI